MIDWEIKGFYRFSITDSRVIHFNEGHEFEKHPEFSKGNVAILAKLKHVIREFYGRIMWIETKWKRY